MTAYLQPGDRIHLSVPMSPAEEDKPGISETLAKAIIEEYNKLGVAVYLVTHVHPDREIQVVSVIREPKPPVIPRIPLMHQPGEKLRAHWGDPDWHEDHLD